MKNAELIVRILEASGVRWIFGVPSGPVLPLIEALRETQVQFVLAANETSAGFMAATVGQLTGIPGVCVGTLGPGATNLTTGVGCGWLDRAPMLVITCNLSTEWLERRVQMRIDHHALFKPLTKATLPLRTRHVAERLAHALALACAEPPGPVHVDLPEDVGLAEATEIPNRTEPSGFLSDLSEETAGVVAAARQNSRRPLVVMGLTFTRSKKARELLGFIEKQQLPFASTLHAKGFLPESHPSWVGVLERARRTEIRAFVHRADLILAFGYDPVEVNYEEWASGIPIVHVSTEAAEASPSLQFRFNRAGDLDRAIESLKEIPVYPNAWSESEWQAHRSKFERSLRPPCKRLGPHHVIDVLREKIPADAILAYDVGAHTHQIASQWRTDLPRTCLSTNGWSSMGFGMPAAFAAKLVHPEREVVALVGDGCFQMTAGELAMAKRLGLSVATVVLNDGWLSLIKVKQERKNYRLTGVFLGEPAETPPHCFGVPARAARDEASLKEALDWALAHKGPTVIDAFIDAEPYSQTVYD
jgi:acetolactate synthase-1/2/3 large subunit